MFEERSISIWTYNLETMLAEKLETIMSRENANTRMRDFFDIHILTRQETINYETLKDAFMTTSEKRETVEMIPRFDVILKSVREDKIMRDMWNKYRDENYFVEDLTWETVNESVKRLKDKVLDLSKKY